MITRAQRAADPWLVVRLLVVALTMAALMGYGGLRILGLRSSRSTEPGRPNRR